eukprot:2861141-Pleurochrysis_carterae.AAC.1
MWGDGRWLRCHRAVQVSACTLARMDARPTCALPRAMSLTQDPWPLLRCARGAGGALPADQPVPGVCAQRGGWQALHGGLRGLLQKGADVGGGARGGGRQQARAEREEAQGGRLAGGREAEARQEEVAQAALRPGPVAAHSGRAL